MSKVFSQDIFFTSDLHFWHTNIIKYCNRPFESVEQMNETLIENWNKTVPKDGIVFLLGDFCFKGKKAWIELLQQLNGELYLIKGNHDLSNAIPVEWFREIKDQMTINIQEDNQEIILNHCPFLDWPNKQYGSWNLHGHIHSSGENSIIPNQYDVGVDNNNYCPISYLQIKERLLK